MSSFRDPARSILAILLTTAAVVAQGDECTGALAIGDGAHGPFTNVGATTSAPAWRCSGALDVWFAYTASCDGMATIDTCGASFDTTLGVFSACQPCGGLVGDICNDGACGLASQLTVRVVTASTYLIRVGGWRSAPCKANVGISVTGDPNLGGVIPTQLHGVTGFPLCGFGFQPWVPVQPGCPPGCRLIGDGGGGIAALDFGTSTALRIPASGTACLPAATRVVTRRNA